MERPAGARGVMRKTTSKVIPQEIVDVAIVAAAKIFGAKRRDVRRGARTHSARRARLVAVAGLAAEIPDATLTGIGRQFGYYANGRGVIERLHVARKAEWWRDDFVEAVADAVRGIMSAVMPEVSPATAAPTSAARATWNAAAERSTSTPVHLATNQTQRRWRVARIAPPPRPRDLAPLLFGDPPKGRREMLETLPSPDYGRSNGRWA